MQPKLAHILKVLKRDFQPLYKDVEVMHKVAATFPEQHISNVVPAVLPAVIMARPQPIIINNNTSPNTVSEKSRQKEKEKKEIQERKENQETIAALTLMGLAVTATAVASYDEASILWRSTLQSDFSQLEKLNRPYGFERINTIIDKYRLWHDLFFKRTKPQAAGKASLLLSGGGAAACFGLGVSMAMPLIGLTASGCFLFWKYLNQDDKDEEMQVFQELCDSITAVLNAQPVPSAPEENPS